MIIPKEAFSQITPYIRELDSSYDGRMRVPARIYGNERIFDKAFGDKSIEQLINVASLPGIVGYAMAMPDMHQGYGFPIGGVAAFDAVGGIVSPGGVGYDINCGVRVLSSAIQFDAIQPYLDKLSNRLYDLCPSGVGGKGVMNLSHKDLDAILNSGARWARKKGYATQDDLERTESTGSITGADAATVPDRAKQRGLGQLGSLGAGNHFLEVDVVETVYDDETAAVFGLQEGMIAVQIHCGSRGLGHEVCGQYLRRLQPIPQKYGIPIYDRELVAAPVNSPEGQDYLAAMSAAANYAFANRQVLAYQVRKAFEQVLAGKVKDWRLEQVYDVAHNIAKMETHVVDGVFRDVIVHRKGATRAFPPRHEALPQVYQKTGQPVLVPGSMGTASYVLAGTKEGFKQTFGSSCHGAGRTMGRRAATRMLRGEDVKAALNDRGIAVRSRSMRGLAEEAPQAYKDVDDVVASVAGAKIARKVARLRPIAVIKG